MRNILYPTLVGLFQLFAGCTDQPKEILPDHLGTFLVMNDSLMELLPRDCNSDGEPGRQFGDYYRIPDSNFYFIHYAVSSAMYIPEPVIYLAMAKQNCYTRPGKDWQVPLIISPIEGRPDMWKITLRNRSSGGYYHFNINHFCGGTLNSGCTWPFAFGEVGD